MKIWVVWMDNGDEVGAEYQEWDIYDLCLSQSSANKSLAEGEKEYPNNDFYIDICTAHD